MSVGEVLPPNTFDNIVLVSPHNAKGKAVTFYCGVLKPNINPFWLLISTYRVTPATTFY